jgi:hypothetical protein
MWKKAKPFLGFLFKGAKWYVKLRYGIDVDEQLREQSLRIDDGTIPIGDDISE